MDSRQAYRMAVTHHTEGRLEAAEQVLKEILRSEPDNPRVLHRLGTIAWQKKDLARAVELIRRAIALKPHVESFHNNLGNALKDLGRTEEALSCYREAVRLNPRYAGAYLNPGSVHRDRGRNADAAAAYEQYLAFRPDDGRVRLIASGLLRRLKHYERAILHCREAIRRNPGLTEAYNEAGGLFFLTGRLDRAGACYRRALEREPDNPQFHANLALVLLHERRPREALGRLEKAQELEPGHANSGLQLAKLRLECCLWERRWEDIRTILDFFENHLEGEARAELEPWTLSQIPSDRGFQLRVARAKAAFCRECAAGLPPLPVREKPSARPARLRIGYVSPDFRQHAVGLLVHGLFKLHDRGRFEVVCYDLAAFPDDDVRRSVRAGADRFVELAGYSNFARPEIFALRPAPVQVQYLGYLDTMAADFIDYTVADRIVLDPEAAGEYTEKIVYLPHTYAPYSGFAAADKPMRRGDFGLPETGVVFCCFNSAYKIDPEVFDSWMRILAAVEGSVLWLLSADDLLPEALRKEAAARGVDPARFVFSGWTSVAGHTARTALADLFLDTFLYNAGTTAVQVLSAGVPVLTLQGDTFLRRMGASIAAAAGLPELACRTREEYEARAIELGGRPEKLRACREKLVALRESAPLYDTAGFVKNLERSYDLMWDNFLRGVREDIDLSAGR